MKNLVTAVLLVSALSLASEFVIGEHSQPMSDPFCGS